MVHAEIEAQTQSGDGRSRVFVLVIPVPCPITATSRCKGPKWRRFILVSSTSFILTDSFSDLSLRSFRPIRMPSRLRLREAAYQTFDPRHSFRYYLGGNGRSSLQQELRESPRASRKT